MEIGSVSNKVGPVSVTPCAKGCADTHSEFIQRACKSSAVTASRFGRLKALCAVRSVREIMTKYAKFSVFFGDKERAMIR